MKRSPRDLVDLALADLRYNGGRRLRGAARVRTRKLRDRVAARLGASGTVVYPIAFGANGTHVLHALRSGASRSEALLMVGGSPGSSTPILHVGVDSLAAFCRLLRGIGTDQELYVGRAGEGHEPLTDRAANRLVGRARSFDLLVVERTVRASPSHVQCSRIEVAVWKPGIGPYAVPFFQSDRELAIVGRLSPAMMTQLSTRQHDFDDDFPAPDQPRFPIDVVYTWVDGDDPAWLELRQRFDPADHPRATRVVHDERFRSRDELKYSLRSLDLFAPWVRRIHIVTADQCPAWLDTSHPKINLVSHRDIYRDTTWLPTFNSSGIETQLHHIPGLARHFLYFNDDFFLGQLTDPLDFFLSNGVIKFFPSSQRAYEPDIAATSEEYIQADRNAIELFKPIMAEVGRSITLHVPYPSDRDLLAEMEERWPAEFAACASARFRSARDLRPIAFMQYHYGYGTGRAVPAVITHRYLSLWHAAIVDQLEITQRVRGDKTICINDVGLEDSRVAEVNAAVATFLESYYPTPSQFERSGIG